MQNITDIGDTDNERKRSDDLCTVYRNNISHQAEYADRGELYDHHKDFHGDFIHAIDKLADLLALFTGSKDTCAEEYCNADYGKHVCINHGLKDVIREYADYNIHDLGRLRCRIFERISYT